MTNIFLWEIVGNLFTTYISIFTSIKIFWIASPFLLATYIYSPKNNPQDRRAVHNFWKERSQKIYSVVYTEPYVNRETKGKI
jgi:hypothetical protein